jgi:hypothetical protein
MAVSGIGFALGALLAAWLLRWLAARLQAIRPGYGLAWLLCFGVAWGAFAGMHLVLAVSGAGMAVETLTYIALPLVFGTAVFGGLLQDATSGGALGLKRGAILAVTQFVFFQLLLLVPALVLFALVEVLPA